MKIYIDNIPLKKVKDKLRLLQKYYHGYINMTEVLSEDGIFNIDSNNIYKIKYNDDKLMKMDNYLNKFNLWIETYSEIKEKIFNLPLNHLSNQIYIIEFKLQNKSPITFITEGSLTSTFNQNGIPCIQSNNNQPKNNIIDYDNYTVTNFYFKVNNNHYPLSDEVKGDLNVFLSLLN
jgi:hypothetical protein